MSRQTLSLGVDVKAVSAQTHEYPRAALLRIAVLLTLTAGSIAALQTAAVAFSNAAMWNSMLARLYLVPIGAAALVFGKRGGWLAGVSVSVLAVVTARTTHFLAGWPALGEGFDIFVFISMGVLLGGVRDEEVRRTREAEGFRRQLESAYAKLEERAADIISVRDYTSSILRSITSGVLTIDQAMTIATVNPAGERMLVFNEHEMVGMPVRSFFRDDGGISSDIERVMNGRVPMVVREVTITTQRGKQVHVQSSVARMRAAAGGVLGVVLTLEDVSDVRALTEQLIRADRLAAMGELTAGVAHEVRNPLGVIRASIQLLETGSVDGERVSEVASVIKHEIDRVDRVIKALLDFGRPGRPTMLEINVNDVVDDVALFTKRFADQAGVTVESRLHENLPRVLGDPDQLKQVFLNLVTNAVQAMEATGGAITITTMSDDDYVDIVVADNGPGIASSDLQKIFDPFFTKRPQGTGLGLTIVHRIIDEHHGHIEVTSSHEGTRFTVSLPAVPLDLE